MQFTSGSASPSLSSLSTLDLVHHPLDPIYDINSRVLILGSFPSIKSREFGFNYAHPQNRFWKVLATVFSEEKIAHPNISFTDRRDFILRHHLALWDVIASCEIIGSSDSSIKNVTPNNIPDLLQKTKITKIFTTGQKAFTLYQKYIFPKTNLAAVCLPSTSPANAKMKLNDLVDVYQVLKSHK